MYIYDAEGIRREWKATDQNITFENYLLKWFYASYDHNFVFKGYKKDVDAYTGRHWEV